MEFVLAMSPTAKSVVLLLFTGVAAPLAGLLFRRVGAGWDSVGRGRFAIEQEIPHLPRHLNGPAPAVDPAIQAAEVRQMLVAKSERRQRRGEAPLEVEAEAQRLLKQAKAGGGRPGEDATLRTEVRQLVVVRNERRMRQGLEPLDVEAETDRQLADFVGSR